MKITTAHTLTFQLRCTGNDRHLAATQIVSSGAQGFGLTARITAMPLPEGEDVATRYSQVDVSSDVRDDLDVYATRVYDALTFIGAEVIEP